MVAVFNPWEVVMGHSTSSRAWIDALVRTRSAHDNASDGVTDLYAFATDGCGRPLRPLDYLLPLRGF